MKKQILYTCVAAAGLGLAACGGNVEHAEINPTPHDSPTGPGIFSGKDGNMLSIFSSDANGGGAAIGVNPYLWRASLESVSFMPVTQADSAGGTILTDWYSNPGKSSERVKVNVYILGKVLAPQSLRVAVFKQEKTDKGWQDMPQAEATARQLEETILTNARAIRVREKASQ